MNPNLISFAGSTFVLYGKASGWSATPYNLTLFDGTNGFRVDGSAASDNVGGLAVSGDLNGDGYADAFIGGYGTSYDGPSDTGSVYGIYGKASTFPATNNIDTLTVP